MKIIHPLSPLILLFALSAAQAQPQYTGKNPQQKILDRVAFTQNIGAALPRKTVFRNLRGEAIELTSLAAERPLILLLAWFDCPHLCPTLLDQLARATAALPFAASDYRVALVGIDPRATPASVTGLARRLRERHGRAISDWQFLTGDAAAIEKLARRIGFHYAYDAQRDSYAHPAGLVIVAPGGIISRYLLRIDPQKPDLRLALVDAGRGELGSPVDQLLLRCYQFDPHNGRYSFAVIRVLQITGGLFLLTMLALLFGLRRRERL